MTTKLRSKPCATCNGSGSVPDDSTGALLRKDREKAGITASAVANHMDISDSFLYDLEKDRRTWTAELVARYQAAMEELVNV